jgi:ankyrin
MPPIDECEARACRIISLAPNAVKFIKPVALEVPHFASLRNGERELVILSSYDGGQNWKELAVENGSGKMHSYVHWQRNHPF